MEKESKAWLDLRENGRRIRDKSGDSSEEFFSKGKLLLGKRGRLKPLKEKQKKCVYFLLTTAMEANRDYRPLRLHRKIVNLPTPKNKIQESHTSTVGCLYK